MKKRVNTTKKQEISLNAFKSPQTYVLQVRGKNLSKLGDLSKDIAIDLENLMLPIGNWIHVEKVK